jgi:hypothetical protein
MKPLVITFYLLPLLTLAQQVEHAFTIREKDFIPEGIAYNPFDKSFYVGSVHKNKIVKISSTGVVSDFVSSHQDSIGQVVGLRIDAQKQEMWACNNGAEGLAGGKSSVHRYNLITGKLIKAYHHQRPGEVHLFNDAVLLNGMLFVTDSDAGAIFKIDPIADKPVLFLQSNQLQYANGITVSTDLKNLVVSVVSGFVSVNPSTKEILPMTVLDAKIFGIDGLYTYKNSLIGIQNVADPTSIVRYYFSDSKKMILRASPIMTSHSSFNVPTTGAIAGDWFYFIANSQLDNYTSGKIKDSTKMEDVTIWRVKLK